MNLTKYLCCPQFSEIMKYFKSQTLPMKFDIFDLDLLWVCLKNDFLPSSVRKYFKFHIGRWMRGPIEPLMGLMARKKIEFQPVSWPFFSFDGILWIDWINFILKSFLVDLMSDWFVKLLIISLSLFKFYRRRCHRQFTSKSIKFPITGEATPNHRLWL